MTSAKIVLNAGPNTYEIVRIANNLAALRFCLKKNDKPDPIAFFVAARVVGFSPYNAAFFPFGICHDIQGGCRSRQLQDTDQRISALRPKKMAGNLPASDHSDT
jgi:hypothetical protein